MGVDAQYGGMVMLEVVAIPVLTDNYVWLLHDNASGETAAVDPSVAEPVLEAAAAKGWRLTQVLNTHWHPDHTGGNAGIQAGTGAQFYLMAVGYKDRAPDNTGTQFVWSGTSFSAPTISGAVALMAEAFPNLTGQQIVQILFDSARDLGASGVDPVYGHGALDIQRAFQPQGQLSMADSQAPVTGSGGDLPPAAGDGGSTGQSLGAIVLDGYSRAYVLDLAKTLRSAAISHPLTRSLQSDVKVVGGNAGPLNISMTVRERHDMAQGFALERSTVGEAVERNERGDRSHGEPSRRRVRRCALACLACAEHSGERKSDAGQYLVAVGRMPAKLMGKQQDYAEDCNRRTPDETPIRLLPRKAQASRLLGMSNKAKTVATTPDVMCRSAR